MTKRYAFVGTWKDFGGHGEGIHVFEIDRDTGDMRQTDHLRGFRNTSILSISEDRTRVYSTIEDKNYQDRWGAGGGLLALAFDAKTGKLKALNETSALGACTSYIKVDPQGKYVLVTNHGSGLNIVTKIVKDEAGRYKVVNDFDDATLVMFSLREDGSIGDACDLHMHPGTGGLDIDGQRCSHLHSVNIDPSGQWVLACDKGRDRIYVYRINREAGLLETVPATEYRARPGTAPRHLDFHPTLPFCFVNNETASTVTALRFHPEDGSMQEVDYQPMIDMSPDVKPEEIGNMYGSPADIHVHPNGKFLYSSERSSQHTGRGTNCISIFAVGEDGRIRRLANEVMDGPCPRGFGIDPDGRFLYVGNQYVDTICRYSIDPWTGLLSYKQIAARVATPTCIRIVDVDG